MLEFGETWCLLLMLLCVNSVAPINAQKHLKPVALNYNIVTQENLFQSNGKDKKVDMVASKIMHRTEDKHNWEEGTQSKLYGHIDVKKAFPAFEKFALKIPVKQWLYNKGLKKDFNTLLGNRDSIIKTTEQTTDTVHKVGEKSWIKQTKDNKDSNENPINESKGVIKNVIHKKNRHRDDKNERNQGNIGKNENIPWKKVFRFIDLWKPSQKFNKHEREKPSDNVAKPTSVRNKFSGIRSTLQSKFIDAGKMSRNGRKKVENGTLTNIHQRAEKKKPMFQTGVLNGLRFNKERVKNFGSQLDFRNKADHNVHNVDTHSRSVGNDMIFASWQPQKPEVSYRFGHREEGRAERFGDYLRQPNGLPLYLNPYKVGGVSSFRPAVSYAGQRYQPTDEFEGVITADHPEEYYLNSSPYNHDEADVEEDTRYSYRGYNIFGIMTEEVTEEELVEWLKHRIGSHNDHMYLHL